MARPDLRTALHTLNAAAYEVFRSEGYSDTAAFPDLDRDALRRIAHETDKLVDAMPPAAPTGKEAA